MAGEICFDSFIDALDNNEVLTDLRNGYNGNTINKNCDHYKNNAHRNNNVWNDSKTDVVSTATPLQGCCLSDKRVNDKTNPVSVNIIDKEGDIDTYYEKLKTDYSNIMKSKFVNEQMSESEKRTADSILSFFDKVTDQTPTSASHYNFDRFQTDLSGNKKNTYKDVLTLVNLKLRRLFLGVEYNLEKMKKKIKNADESEILKNIDDSLNELKKIDIEEKSDIDKKLQYFDKNNYTLYEIFFYSMLVVSGILFVRTQLNK